MDKYEYKIRAEEIKALIAEGEYQQAAEIADSIDWRKVKSVMMLCTISDLYKINRRFEESRDLLLLAYDRHPGGRTIVYSLCELSIKMGEFLQAMEYYKEFVQIAPKDSGRYILQYKLYEAQDVSLEERIAVLEELKKRDYREKWAYELAYLYHRVGLATRCVEECDELILWFGDGKYVIKAMELKMLHVSLTPDQQSKYNNRFHTASIVPEYQEEKVEELMEKPVAETAPEPVDTYDENIMKAPTTSIPTDEVEIQVKTMDVSQYNTINLQKELAEGLKEILGEHKPDRQEVNGEKKEEFDANGGIEFDTIGMDTATMAVQRIEETISEEAVESEESAEVFFGDTGEIKEIILPEQEVLEVQEAAKEVDRTALTIMEQMRMENIGAEPPKEMANVLSMEYDGQIKLVLPEKENVEKQITGQLNIEDIMAEWERMKRENQEKNKEVLRKKVLEQTGPMFTEFEASIRDGVLEQLEKGNRETDIDAQVEAFSQEFEEVSEEEYELQNKEDPVEDDFVEDDSVEELAEIEEAAEVVPEEETIEESDEETEFEAVFEEEFFEEAVEEELEEEIPEEAVEEELEEEIPEEAVEEELEEEILEEAVEEELEEEIPEETVEEEFEEEIPEETVAEELEEEPVKQEEPIAAKRVRELSEEEQEVYAIFAQTQDAKEKLIKAIDAISMAAYTGNVIITGEESSDTFMLAKNMLHEVQANDPNFTGRIAKIKARSLNQRDVNEVLSGLANGALIIHRAAEMTKKTVMDLYHFLQQENFGIIIVLEDSKQVMNKFLKVYQELSGCFTSRMDLEALSDEVLVTYAKKYARDREFSIDELGILALHTRINDLQTSEHVVTISDVVEIMEEAMQRASKKSIGHFFDVVFAKRYDEEDMIVLREKDFD